MLPLYWYKCYLQPCPLGQSLTNIYSLYCEQKQQCNEWYCQEPQNSKLFTVIILNFLKTLNLEV